MKVFLILLFLFPLFFSLASAEMTGFPNGSFESNSMNNWVINNPKPLFGCNSGLGIAYSAYNPVVTQSWSTAGDFSTRFVGTGNDPPTGQVACAQLIPDNNVFDGNFVFYVDYKFTNASGNKTMSFVINGSQTVCSLTIGTGTQTTSGTFECAPNISGNYTVDFLFKCSGGAGTCSFSGNEIYFDNFRYEENNEVCRNIIYNGSPSEKIDVVFIGSGFPSLDSFASTMDDMIDYDESREGLMSFEPFKTYKNRFNFWRVDTLQTFHGGIVLGSDGNYFHDKSYEFDARNLATSNCLGISENPPQIVTLMVNPKVQSHAYVWPFTAFGMGNAYITIGQEYLNGGTFSLNVPKIPTSASPILQIGPFGNSRTDIQRTFVHEFGHSFGGLADEYTSLESGTLSFGQPNCDENYLLGGYACDKWQNICPSTDAQCCLPGCSYASFYRPYHNSIMNSQFDYTTTFMPVSENELEKDINALTGALFSQVESLDYSYILQWQYSSGDLSLIGASVINKKTQPAIVQPENAYRIVIKSMDNEGLYDINFAMPISISLSADYNWFDINGIQTFFPDNAPILPVNDFNFTIALPYFSNGKEAQIFDANNALKLIIDLSPFATKINYFIGYGGEDVSSMNYNANYTLLPQPTGVLTSTNYICKLGNTN